MPEYALRCPACKHTWDEFATMSSRSLCRCPKCQAVPETDYARCTFRQGNRVFALREQESVVHWVPEADVSWVRAAYGGANVQDDGTVTFKDRADERAFNKRKAAWEKREQAKNRERAEREAEAPAADTIDPDGLKGPLKKPTKTKR